MPPTAAAARTAPEPTPPPTRGVARIKAELDAARAQHKALRAVVEQDTADLAQARRDWDSAHRMRQNAVLQGGEFNPYMHPALPPRPAPPEDALDRANALHALAYVLKELEDDLAAFGVVDRHSAYREDVLARAGVRLHEALPPPAPLGPDEARARREELLRKAGITPPADPTPTDRGPR